jgi:hypothetical protein
MELARPKRRVVAGVVVLVILAAGVAWAYHNSEKQPTVANQSPVLTTEAWFAAVNAHDMPLAKAHFAPADRSEMDWSSWGQPFTDLHCSQGPHSQSSAVVNCTFATQNDPNTGMSNVNAWSVTLTHEKTGRWLITTYGQG